MQTAVWTQSTALMLSRQADLGTSIGTMAEMRMKSCKRQSSLVIEQNPLRRTIYLLLSRESLDLKP